MYGAKRYNTREVNRYRINNSNHIEYEIDNRRYEKNGAWVYRDGTRYEWVFERYDCIADAVKRAIRLKEANVIVDGLVVHYGKIDSTRVYYIDPRINRVRVIVLSSERAREYNNAYI